MEINSVTKKWRKHSALYSVAVVSSILLTACGGGGGSGGDSGGGGGVQSSSSVESSLSSSSEASSSSQVTQSSSSEASEQPFTVNSPDALSKGLEFDGAIKMNRAIPAPGNASGGSLEVSREVAITAGGGSQLLVKPVLEDGYYVHAYMVQLEGVEETFVIPVGSDGLPMYQQSRSLAASDLPGKVDNQLLALKTGASGPVANDLSGDDRIQLSCFGRPVIRFDAPSYSAPARVQAYVQPQPPVQSMDYDAFRDGLSIPTDFWSIDTSSWTQPAEVEIKAVEVGSGELQITLSWDSNADVDLHLEEPGGNTIYYGNPNSAEGDGYLDVDDIDGFGPENIFFDTDIPGGEYTIKVHMYSAYSPSDLPTSYTVTLKNDGSVNTFNGTLTADDEMDVITNFTQAGSVSGGNGQSSSAGGGQGRDNGQGNGNGGSGDGSGIIDDVDSGSGDLQLGACGVKQYGFTNICYTNYPTEACDLLADEMAGLADVFTYHSTDCGSGYNCSIDLLTYDGQSIPADCLD
ncbi:YfaP family protein [Gilvimarinus sp. DA14]|uniref:YfaP family protein n=1 Tax=Gilvimarinus sp. DA14 TaxID=2956798 RepID=UPI0020B7C6C2|nr:hypothetical protein [Gilvimarinus sp. DA14]UTF58910.1 hypothetical protein NHM04_10515 [Gilvimarinus sp. DA14]